jgi:hypothetical protein
METLPEISDAEEDFIDRAVNPKLNSRLACQCRIIADVEVTIPAPTIPNPALSYQTRTVSSQYYSFNI